MVWALTTHKICGIINTEPFLRQAQKENDMKVIKRDGSTAEFDKNKILVAISKANEAVDFEDRVTETQIAEIVEDIASRHRTRMLVEQIQDLVEEHLMELRKYPLMKAYILYRYERALVRKANTTDDSILSLIKNDNKDVKIGRAHV